MNIEGLSGIVLEPIEEDVGGRRSREIEAVARLVGRVFGKDAVMNHRADGSPYIEGCDGHISISHTRRYAALAWSSLHEVGIDIEEPRHEQLEKVAKRFLTPEEYKYYSDFEDGLLKAWTLKEAAFKALRNGSVDLREYLLPIDGECSLIKVGYKELKIAYSGFVPDLPEKLWMSAVIC